MLGNIFNHLAGILIEQRIVLQDQDAVAILLQHGHELEAGESPAHIHLGDIAIQAAEDAGVVAANEEDFVPLKIEVVVDSIDQHLRWGDKDVEGIFLQGDCWMQFDFHNWIWAVPGI